TGAMARATAAGVNNVSEEGGFVADTAHIGKTILPWIRPRQYKPYIGRHVQICDNAKVSGDAFILDKAKIFENAEIAEEAMIFGNAMVFGNSKVYWWPKIGGNARIHGNATISHKAIINGSAEIYGNAFVINFSRVLGNAKISEDAIIAEEAIIYGSAVINGNARIGGMARVHDFAHVFGLSYVAGTTIVNGDAQITQNLYANPIIAGVFRGTFPDPDLNEEIRDPARILLRDRPLNQLQSNYANLIEIKTNKYKDKKIEEIFKTLQETASLNPNLGIVLKNPLDLNTIESAEDLFKILQAPPYKYQGSINDLKDMLMKMLINIEVYLDHLASTMENTMANTSTDLNKFKIDPIGAATGGIGHIDYNAKLKNLNLPTNNKHLQKLFKAISTPEVLDKLCYLDPSDSGDNKQKVTDLARFFNEITETIDFISGNYGLGNYSPAYFERPKTFKNKIMYETSMVANKVNQLTLEQKQMLAQNLIHAGRHCPDAKRHQSESSYFTICTDQFEEDQNSIYDINDRYAHAYLLAQKIKRDILTSIIQNSIASTGATAESASIFAATWDRLAPSLGLEKTNTPYPGLALRNITTDDFFKKYTVKKLVNAYKKENSERILSENAQLLREFVDKDLFTEFFSKLELIKFGLLKN
ncbi:MAG: hypothetical protein HQK53_17520, partial [Oligoflexia bacterium]|nr:hypothetical protein [Oligoflexia bacterium]